MEPAAVGLEIACTLRRLYGDKWDVDKLDTLLVNRNVLEAIRGGADRSALEPIIRPGLEKFKERRREFLLYPE